MGSAYGRSIAVLISSDHDGDGWQCDSKQQDGCGRQDVACYGKQGQPGAVRPPSGAVAAAAASAGVGKQPSRQGVQCDCCHGVGCWKDDCIFERIVKQALTRCWQ
ncbi:hypothetical protein ABBQ32_006922 [Trebouxia sp. C0010 RCD-2024]